VQFQDRGPAEYLLGRDPLAFFTAMLRGPATHNLDVFPDEVIARYVEQFSPEGALTPPLEYYRNLDHNWGLSAGLPTVTETPALMISAQFDPVLTPAMADGMEERVPNLTKVVIADSGHWTQQEQPEATNKATIEFLTSLPSWS
jgi:pimeloyl-ACP methyl ester carboxylesterase